MTVANKRWHERDPKCDCPPCARFYGARETVKGWPLNKWDKRYFDMARLVSTWATCPRASIGAVLVRDNRVLGLGFNGAPSGESHCADIGCEMVDNHCLRSTHAEANAIATAAKEGISLKGAAIYVVGPRDICPACRNLIKAAGINKVMWME
jgi:dCMP deaminase